MAHTSRFAVLAIPTVLTLAILTYPAAAQNEIPFYLTASQGGVGGGPAMALPPGTGFVTLIIDPSAPRAASDGEPLRFEIRDGGGHVVWSSATTAGEIRRTRQSAARLVRLQVPASVLPAGAYALTLGRIGQGSGERLLEAPFRITARAI